MPNAKGSTKAQSKTSTKKTTTKAAKKADSKKTTQKGGAKKVTSTKATKASAKQAEPKAEEKPDQKGGAKKAGAKKAAAKTEEEPATEAQTGGAKKQRFFKVVTEDGSRGRFSGLKPKQAANKALTSIIQQRKANKQSITGDIKFKIVEVTRNSKKKEYSYVGERKKLAKPMTVKIGDKEINYRYNNVVRKNKTTE